MALIVGGVALALSRSLSGLRNPTQFFDRTCRLICIWVGIPLGSIAILMMITWRRRMGYIIRRPLKLRQTFPAMAILFLPMFFGLPRLYLRANWRQWPPIPHYKRSMVFVESVICFSRGSLFCVVDALAYFLSKWSIEHHQSGQL